MSTNIHPGYMGYANIGGTNVRFADANITARQDVLIPDMVMGNFDRAAYTFGKVEVGGSISGPVTESFAAGAGSIWDWAFTRDSCGALTAKDVSLYYFCGGDNGSRTFPQVLANNCTFSCAAGDVAQFSVEVMGATAPTWGGGVSGNTITTTEKLLTWDKVGVSIASGGVSVPTNALLSNFEFTINNNVQAMYAITDGSNYFPTALVPGLRTITGSISCYDPQAFNGVDGYDNFEADGGRSTISFSIGSTSVSFKVQFHRVEPTLSAGPIVATVAFTGAGVQT
jgi:hypothetical protein